MLLGAGVGGWAGQMQTAVLSQDYAKQSGLLSIPLSTPPQAGARLSAQLLPGSQAVLGQQGCQLDPGRASSGHLLALSVQLTLLQQQSLYFSTED